MAGERTFTEGEAYALVADGIERETAAANTTIAEHEATIVTLGNEKDALEVRATAAEEKAATAEQALEDYKAEQETQKAAEGKRAERVAKVAEVAPKLEITDERSDRIVAMADEAFDQYVADLKAVAPAAAPEGEPKNDPTTGVPRQSAAFKGTQPSGGDGAKASVKGIFAARNAARHAPAKAS